MERVANFGNVFRDKGSGEIAGTSIDVKTIEELRNYEQVPKTENKKSTNGGSFVKTKGNENDK